MAKDTTKEYKAEYLKEYIEPVFEAKKVPGINDIQIDSKISIDT